MAEYKRTLSELKQKASMFWPVELISRESELSVLPLLLRTQDKFISILNVSDARPDSWKVALKGTASIKPNLFLKHLMVLADMGGEPLNRLDINDIYPMKTMTYGWQGTIFDYKFKAISNGFKLNNKSLFVDGKSLIDGHELTMSMEDIIMLLLYGGASIDVQLPPIIKDKCIIGNLIGRNEELEKFVKQRYIWVSRITNGAKANSLGQIAQDYVKERLDQALPGWQITRNGTIPGISQNEGRTSISFDIVAKSPKGKYVAIEVSFQETTNSTIERKQGQARDRANMLRQKGYKIAYVIDGAGNFERQAAFKNILQYSDCTVTFTPEEIDILISFLRECDTPANAMLREENN